MKRILALILASLMLIAMLVACSGGTSPTPAPSQDVAEPSQDAEETPDEPADTDEPADKGEFGDFETEGLRYALVVKNLTNPYWIALVNGMQEYCDEHGIALTVQATEDDTAYEEQVTICETLLTQNYDAILVTPLSNTTICSFIKDCNDFDQPIFILDSAADADTLAALGAAPTATFEADNYTSGCVATEYLIEAIGEHSEIVIITGNMASEAAIQINYGMLDTLEGYPDVEVLSVQAANWNRNMGYEVAETLLTAHPNVQGILAANDEMGLGAMNAVAAAGLEDQITIVSINFMDDAKEAIKAGKIYASVDKGPYIQGVMSAEVATNFLAGNEINDYYQIPVVGYTANDF